MLSWSSSRPEACNLEGVQFFGRTLFPRTFATSPACRSCWIDCSAARLQVIAGTGDRGHQSTQRHIHTRTETKTSAPVARGFISEGQTKTRQTRHAGHGQRLQRFGPGMLLGQGSAQKGLLVQRTAREGQPAQNEHQQSPSVVGQCFLRLGPASVTCSQTLRVILPTRSFFGRIPRSAWPTRFSGSPRTSAARPRREEVAKGRSADIGLWPWA